MKRYHRSVHAVSALVVALCWAATLYVWPDLRKDVATGFGTLSGFATFYGLVFTIIEVLYTRGAAEQAAVEARKAAEAARGVFELRNISECLSAIENILDQLKNENAASTTLISRVVKMYSSQFAHEIDDGASPHRRNLDVVEAYTFSLRPRRANVQHADFQRALMSMTSQLSSISAKRTEKVQP